MVKIAASLLALAGSAAAFAPATNVRNCFFVIEFMIKSQCLHLTYFFRLILMMTMMMMETE